MPDETKKPKRKTGAWSAARQHLSTLDKPALIALVKDLHDSSPANRDFIQARCQAGDGEALENYRHKVIARFFSGKAHGMGDLKLGEARKAIREYKKATGSIPGTVELLMTYVENGVEFTNQYGDIDERFYNSIESALSEVATMLGREARELYPHFSARLASLEQATAGMGWGFHDFIADVVGSLEEELGSAE